ncbi:MAG: hypothetical protein DYG93_11450 [Leptolyngbya sp. PLA2]|nr:hypothetical protein [Leptolyngbya sp. PL-A2]
MVGRGMAAMVAARGVRYALTRVRVAVLVNERSGRGRARLLGASAAAALSRAGHHPLVVPVGPGSDGQAAAGALGDCSLAVIVGGDGTVNHLLQTLTTLGVPLYHLPTGNENLLACEFNMSVSVPRLLAAVERGRVVRMDLARCNGRAFVLMASIGPDAGVIHRLDASRSRAIGHAAYVCPVLSEVVRPHLPRMTMIVDGEQVVEGKRGFAVIANSRHYGLRIDPCPAADVSDGLLDSVFFPASSSLAVIAWMAVARFGRQFTRPSCVRARGRVVEVRSDEVDAPCQIDGEVGPAGVPVGDQNQATWRCAVEPRAISVLVPG